MKFIQKKSPTGNACVLVMEISSRIVGAPIEFEVLACEFRQESKIAEIVAKVMLEIWEGVD